MLTVSSAEGVRAPQKGCPGYGTKLLQSRCLKTNTLLYKSAVGTCILILLIKIYQDLTMTHLRFTLNVKKLSLYYISSLTAWIDTTDQDKESSFHNISKSAVYTSLSIILIKIFQELILTFKPECLEFISLLNQLYTYLYLNFKIKTKDSVLTVFDHTSLIYFTDYDFTNIVPIKNDCLSIYKQYYDFFMGFTLGSLICLLVLV